MKTFTLTATAALLSATAALASTDIADLDANGDRFASRSEVSAVFPGFLSSDFRRLDSNRDQRLSAVEVQQPGARAIIARYETAGPAVTGLAQVDANGSGFASFDELAAVYPGLNGSDFREIDTNDDRRVSFNELYDPRAQSVVSRYEGMAGMLQGIAQIDSDGDNFASFTELAAQYPGLDRFDFDRIDGNGDNRVNFVELYQLESRDVLNRSGS